MMSLCHRRAGEPMRRRQEQSFQDMTCGGDVSGYLCTLSVLSPGIRWNQLVDVGMTTFKHRLNYSHIEYY